MRNLHTRQCSLLGFVGLFLAGALLSFPAAATPAASGETAEINARFAQEKAKCESSKAGAELAACLKAANITRSAAPNAPNYDDATYRSNKFDRCRVLNGKEASDCFARMKGEGTKSGSVESGAIVREKVTVEVAPVPTPAASAP